MARTKEGDHYQVPLMFAFRDAARNGDARQRLDERRDGERIVSARGSLRRRGAVDDMLKDNLAVDIVALLNTIDLHSAEPLDEYQHVSRSVLNFGLNDVTRLTSQEEGVDHIESNLIGAILQFEPRLHADTLIVTREEDLDEVNQRIRFRVSAEMSCRPFDLPVEFVAELDVGSGKLRLARSPGGAG